MHTRGWSGLLSHYKKWLPITESTPKLSLGEGRTPLIYSARLSERVSANVFLKYEGANPTGSFKDRGMVLAVAKAIEAKSNAVICASTGNTSASAAAYAARAGIQSFILIPHGYVALGKLAQATIYGAKIIAIRGNFDRALELVQEAAQTLPVTVVNSINPYRLEGQQTAAFEICEDLGHAPDHLCIPVGNAGNISAYWKGFHQFFSHQIIDTLPKMHGFEAAGAAALVTGKPVVNPETFATAIRIGNPASAQLAMTAVRDSQGSISAVSDDEIRAAYRLIASEGIFVEPASAASVAGLLQLHANGRIKDGANVVCVLTGNGLKDPDNAIQSVTNDPVVVDADEAIIHAALERRL